MREKSRAGKVWQIISCLLGIILALSVLPLQETRAEGDYGTDAYAYMEYLQGTYPYRAVGTQTLADAEGWLLQTVGGFGYACALQPFTVEHNGAMYSGENIIFEKPGNSSQVIVVGAHYDCVEATQGTDDNATGVGVLLETAKRLAGEEGLPYTVRFILFSAEEPGCLGSQYYVDCLSAEQRDQILCMINLDTLGAGDYMYLYGGGVDENGNVVRTWLVEQAMSIAQGLGLDMHYHPDVNPNYPVPVKNTYSDQQGFDGAGITYLYFEGSNWNGGNFDNIYQTSNPDVENGKMLHTPAYENLEFYHAAFGNRMEEHLTAFSTLLDYLLHHLQPWTGAVSIVPELTYEERSETVWAVSNVNIRTAPSTSSEILEVLLAGEPVLRTGYNEDWCRVEYAGGEAYIKTEYLTEVEPETTEEETSVEETILVEIVPEETSGQQTAPEETTVLQTEAASEELTEEEEASALQTADREEPETAQELSENSAGMKKIWLFFGCIGVAVLALILGIVILFRMIRKKN